MPRLTERFRDALAFALRAHDAQTRKGTAIPYVSHPLQVAGIALEHGADEDQAMAAVLHDALEDTAATYEDLRNRFGRRVADIVRGCSDSKAPQGQGSKAPEGKAPWRERKERYLAHLEDASPDVALVSASDKLHNARSIVADLHEVGIATFERFTGKRDGTLWYYRELVKRFDAATIPPALQAELGRAVATMVDLAGDEP